MVIINMIQLRWMGLTGYVARKIVKVYKMLIGKHQRMGSFEVLVTDGNAIILKRILKKLNVRTWIGFIWLKTESNSWLCEHGNEI
jgi:phosphoserine phosphatase